MYILAKSGPVNVITNYDVIITSHSNNSTTMSLVSLYGVKFKVYLYHQMEDYIGYLSSTYDYISFITSDGGYYSNTLELSILSIIW